MKHYTNHNTDKYYRFDNSHAEKKLDVIMFGFLWIMFLIIMFLAVNYYLLGGL